MERIVISKANKFVNLGHSVYIVTNSQHDRPPFFKINDGIKCVDLDINYDEIENTSFLKKTLKYLLKQIAHKKRLQKFVSEIKPDIIISTYGYEINFLHKLKTSAKKIAEIHFSRDFRLYRNRQGLWKLANKWLSHRSFENIKKYDAFVCLTKEDSKKWNGLPNLYVIPNFIEEKANTPAPLNSKEVIAVGRLNYQKGYDRMISIWKKVNEKYPDWKLHIYGNGELKEELQNKIYQECLSSGIELTAPVNDIYKKLSMSSIYIMTSRYEGLPMVLLEAMACGLPIVSFNCPCGPTDLLESSNAGFLIKDGDEDEFANKIISLIEDKNQREIVGKNSYRYVDNFTADKVISKWISLFEKLLSD